MAAGSRTRSGSGSVNSNSAAFQSSISSAGRISAASGGPFASYSSSFAARSSSNFFNSQPRSTSPNRVSIVRSSSSSSPSVRFSFDRRPTSPGRPLAVDHVVKKPIGSAAVRRRTCMCSPTTHPGSFRCSLHKGSQHHHTASPPPSNRLNARRSAMTNSLVRIATVEGDLVKRALAALIRPSSHQQRRRLDFQPRRSRLSVVSTATAQ